MQDQPTKTPREGADEVATLTQKLADTQRQLTHQKRLKNVLSLCLALLLIGGSLHGFYKLWHLSDAPLPFSIVGRGEGKPLADKLNQALHLLKQNYYQPVTDEKLVDAAIAGTAGHLGSPFTHYLTQEQVAAFREQVSGHYSGIGTSVQYEADTGNFILTNIQPGSPAAQGGIEEGDILTAVEGRSAREFKNPTELARVVKGPEGTKIHLEIMRPSEQGKRYTFELTRAQIKTQSVLAKTLEVEGQTYGYVRLREFTQTLADQAVPVLEDLVNQKGLKNIVLDLRNNPGGDAEAMVRLLDAILDEGPIASIEGRLNGQTYHEDWKTEAKAVLPQDVRFVILLNEHSASAAEFFSGALRDRGRATLVGHKTFGKGVATQTFNLKDGSALQITTFEYILPNGDHVEGKGLKPDVAVEPTEAARGKNVETLSLADDAVLQRALEVFKK